MLGAGLAQANEESDQPLLRGPALARAQVEQLLPLLRLGEECEDGGHALGIARRGFENLAERGDGLGRGLELVALDLGDAQEIGTALEPRHLGLGPPGQGRHQLRPAAGALENLDGARQRLAIVLVRGQALVP